MFRALQDIAKAHGLDVALHKPREFTAGLSGFFAALHWCELQGARAAVVENVLHAFTNYTGGPAAIFIKPTRKLLQSELWAQVISQAKVVEEPEPNETTIEAIASYALGRSDLLPPVGLGSDPAFRSHLSTRLPFYLTINDVFQDIDDYILTRDGVSSYATEVEPTAPEQGLVRTLRTFLNEPNAKQERALIGQTLLRGDSELLAIGALTAATAGLIFRSEDESGPADGATTDLVLWATAVLASQLGIAILRGGYAPSWRENPDGRAFAVAQLCRDYRRARVDRDHRAWLVHVAGEALSRVPLLEAGDGTAVRRLGERLKERLSTIEPRSGWLDEVFAALKGTNVVVRSLSPDFRVRWSAISNQRAVVARLCRLIIDDRHQGAILLHGFAPEAKAQIAGAWIKACLCEAPSAGEGCGKCDSCRSLVDGGSPSSGIAHLGTEPRHDKDETGAKAAAEHQVDQVRNLIIDGGLWPGRRVIVLDGVDKVRKGALDRLLKVIEEAPSLVSLVFLAERYGSVPAAIRSRSRASVAVKVSPTTASA
jgi:hypothetical protein